jgi:hypothetical protein
MSFVGFLVAACLPPSVDLSGLKSTDDLGSIQLDEEASVIAFSRNDWLNNRLDEIAQLHCPVSLPTKEVPIVASSGSSLGLIITELRDFLHRLKHERMLLSVEALEQAEEPEVRGALEMVPSTLQAAMLAFKAATARDEDGERLETLLCLMWRQLRLAEQARTTGYQYISVRSQ